jgi:hypothetical protein
MSLAVDFLFRCIFRRVTAKEAPMSCLRWLVLIAGAGTLGVRRAGPVIFLGPEG